MVLVTGAGGLTGQAVIKALAKKDIEVCALVHRESQSGQMMAIGKRTEEIQGKRIPAERHAENVPPL